MALLHKVKRTSTMTICKEDSYTLETLPETINYNQFYCYSTYSGKIYIGTIIGKSALRPYFFNCSVADFRSGDWNQCISKEQEFTGDPDKG